MFSVSVFNDHTSRLASSVWEEFYLKIENVKTFEVKDFSLKYI